MSTALQAPGGRLLKEGAPGGQLLKEGAHGTLEEVEHYAIWPGGLLLLIIVAILVKFSIQAVAFTPHERQMRDDGRLSRERGRLRQGRRRTSHDDWAKHDPDSRDVRINMALAPIHSPTASRWMGMGICDASQARRGAALPGLSSLHGLASGASILV